MAGRTWMVRAGRRGVMIDAFRQASRVAIGWAEAGSLAEARTRADMAARVRATWPDWNAYEVGNNAGQLHRFRSEIQAGDRVVSYDPEGRVYHVGTVTGDYAFDPAFDPDLRNVRPVRWQGAVPRDALSVSTKNSLGSVTTVFLVPAEAAQEIEAALERPDQGKAPPPEPAPEEAAAEQDLFVNKHGIRTPFSG